MQLGSNFKFFLGIVEDINDPLQLGRVRVRCLNIHSLNLNEVPTDTLPWAVPIQPTISASHKTIGQAPFGLLVGSIVVGFFLDEQEMNQPLILGSIAGIPGGIPNNFGVDSSGKPSKSNSTASLDSDIPLPARGVNDYENNFIEGEPPSQFSEGSLYPFNQCFKTVGGHLIEYDSTPGNERIQVRHVKGSYIQLDKDGNIVIKAVGNTHVITTGNVTEYTDKNHSMHVKGNLSIVADGNVVIIGQRIDLNP